MTLVLIRRDGGLSTLCHSCRFDYQQKVLKTFPGPSSLLSKDGKDQIDQIVHVHLISNFLKTFPTQETIIRIHGAFTRSIHWRCSVKKVFFKISQNSQESTPARVSFLTKLQVSSLQLY